jgi:hypothetical protein
MGLKSKRGKVALGRSRSIDDTQAKTFSLSKCFRQGVASRARWSISGTYLFMDNVYLKANL